MKNKIVFPSVRMNWLAAVTGMFCLTLATGALAEERNRPCADDAAKLCKGVQQGEGRVAQCLKEHANELSPACKENIGKMKEKIQEFKEACQGDATKLCKDVKPGGGRILQCLKQHEGELSASCKKEMAQSKGRRK